MEKTYIPWLCSIKLSKSPITTIVRFPGEDKKAYYQGSPCAYELDNPYL